MKAIYMRTHPKDTLETWEVNAQLQNLNLTRFIVFLNKCTPVNICICIFTQIHANWVETDMYEEKLNIYRYNLQPASVKNNGGPFVALSYEFQRKTQALNASSPHPKP